MNKTKKVIFEAAVKSFSRRGYHKTTMDEIAETAGVAKGTLYYHFKSKEEIFTFIIEEGVKVIENEIKDRTDYLDNPVDRLRTVCQVQLELVIKYFEFFKTVFSQIWGDEERQDQLRGVVSRYFKLIESYIEEAADEGVIAKTNIDIIAFNFFGVMSSTVAYSLMHRDMDVDELIDTLLDFIMRGIGKK